jgi:hypothetical protein
MAARKKNSSRRRSTARRPAARRSTARRTNTHLKVGTAVSFKGHGAKVVKQHAGDKYTIRFPATGSKKVVAGSSLKRANGLAVRRNAKKKNPIRVIRNPHLAFKRHGGKAEPITFFAHKTRQKKSKTGTGSYRRKVGGKMRTLRGKGAGLRSSTAPKGFARLGRTPTSSVLTKAQQNERNRAAWKALPKAKKAAILKRLRAGHAKSKR